MKLSAKMNFPTIEVSGSVHVSLLTLSEVKRITLVLFPHRLSETIGFLMISGGTEIN